MKIYHNPKCTKSRQTLQLLRDHHIEPEIIEYLTSPPTVQELDGILKKLNMEPAELVRKKEARELKLDFESLDRDAAIAVLVENPRVIERPIVVAGRKAVIGRPPENVLGLLE